MLELKKGKVDPHAGRQYIR